MFLRGCKGSHFFRDAQEEEVECDARDESGDSIDGIVGHDVDRGEAEQDVERYRQPQQEAVAGTPDEHHADGGNAHMRTGESCRRALAGRVHVGHHLIEEAAGVARCGQEVSMREEVVAHLGKDPMRDGAHSDGFIIEHRPGDGQQVEYQVIGEERCQDDEHAALELPETTNEIEKEHFRDEEEVEKVKRMIARAKERLSQVSDQPEKEDENTFDAFDIAMLM